MYVGFVIFVLVITTTLAIPVNFSFHLSVSRVIEYTVKLRWLFGLVNVNFPLLQSEVLLDEEAVVQNVLEQTKSAMSSNKKHSFHGKTSPLSAIIMKPFRQRLIRLISDLWRAIEKRNLCLFIRVGLDDPADTGKLWAMIGPLSGLASNIEEASIQIEPEFNETIFKLNSSGSFRVVPLRLIYLIIGAFLSPPLWRGIKQMQRV